MDSSFALNPTIYGVGFGGERVDESCLLYLYFVVMDEEGHLLFLTLFGVLRDRSY